MSKSKQRRTTNAAQKANKLVAQYFDTTNEKDREKITTQLVMLPINSRKYLIKIAVLSKAETMMKGYLEKKETNLN